MIHGIRYGYSPIKTKYRYYLQLIKPFTVLSALIAVLLLGIYGHVPFQILLPLAVSIALSQGFGQAINQIEDIDIDKINKPYRPLPSNKISVDEAWKFSLSLFVLSEALVVYNLHYFTFVSILNFFAFFYSVEPIRAKKHIWSVLWMAISRGALPVYIILGLNPIVLIAFLWVLAFQITKDFGDEIGDSKYGVRTIPNTIGKYSIVYMYSFLTLYTLTLILLHMYTLLFTVPIGIAIPLLTKYRSITDNSYAWNLYYIGLFTIYLLLLIN